MNELIEQLTLTGVNVLKLIIEGKTNKEIAAILKVSVSTVKWHVQKALDKTGIRDRKLLIVEFYSTFRQKN